MNRVEKVLNDRLEKLLIAVSVDYGIPINSVRDQFRVWKNDLSYDLGFSGGVKNVPREVEDKVEEAYIDILNLNNLVEDAKAYKTLEDGMSVLKDLFKWVF